MEITREIFYDGAQVMRYQLSGAGTVVCLIHGFGEDSQIWQSLATRLVDSGYSVIIPDLPGSGQSPYPGYSMEMDDFAFLLKSMLQQEAVEQVVLIGHSMGGYISLAFTENYPDMVMGLGLFHSSAFADDAQKIETRKKAITVIEAKGTGAFLKTAIPGLFYDTEKHSGDITVLLEHAASFSAAALSGYYQSMINRQDRTSVLKGLKVPLLLIAGKYDTAILPEKILKQSVMAGMTYLLVLQHSGHMGMLEEPGACEIFITKFLHDIK